MAGEIPTKDRVFGQDIHGTSVTHRILLHGALSKFPKKTSNKLNCLWPKMAHLGPLSRGNKRVVLQKGGLGGIHPRSGLWGSGNIKNHSFLLRG